MTDHAARAEHVLDHLENAIRTGDTEWAPIMAAQAQTHATLEQAKWLREIADQLDTIPRRPDVYDHCDETDRAGARCRLPRKHNGHHSIGLSGAPSKDYTALFPLHDAADLLEGLAIGDEVPAREMTIARLVLHQVMPYPHAERIAGDSRLIAHRSTDPWRPAEVEAAITLLKIEVPVVDAEVINE